MYDIYVEEKVMAFEEANLENKYPDFRALMREYREGILLFEITKNEVWDKASQDTIGLRGFFDQNRDKYRWDKRAELTKINLESADVNKIVEFHKLANKKGLAKAMDKYKNESGFTLSDEVVTKELNDPEILALKQQNGSLSEIFSDKDNSYFYSYNQTLEPSYKTLKEARGYVIADYQDHLEQKWVDGLKKAYLINVDDKVLKSLIK